MDVTSLGISGNSFMYRFHIGSGRITEGVSDGHVVWPAICFARFPQPSTHCIYMSSEQATTEVHKFDIYIYQSRLLTVA